VTSRFSIVCFDVDSTLVTIEGIDILGAGNAAITTMTEKAMNGEIPLDEAYRMRLEIIQPSRQRVDALGEQYVRSIVEGGEETIGELRDAGVDVHLVTAGIAQAIAPLAQRLRIAARHVHSVDLRFDAQGRYEGFDDQSPLTKPGGKGVVVRGIRASAPGKATAFVGDGVSDLETKNDVDLFIGYGGVAERPKVKAGADVYVTERDLRNVLKHLSHD